MSKLKTICMFCGKQHKTKTPELCKAKGKLMSSYMQSVQPKERWSVFHAIDRGMINLEAEAKKLIAATKKRNKGGGK